MIGFVENGDRNGVEVNEPLLHKVFEPTGGCDDDVDAVAQCLNLAVLRNTTEDCHRPKLVCVGEGLQRCRNLRCQLTGWGKNHARWATRFAGRGADGLREAHDHRNGEGERLARAGFSAAENVATSEGVGQSVDLNRKRAVFAVRREDVDKGSGHAERAECGCSH